MIIIYVGNGSGIYTNKLFIMGYFKNLEGQLSELELGRQGYY